MKLKTKRSLRLHDIDLVSTYELCAQESALLSGEPVSDLKAINNVIFWQKQKCLCNHGATKVQHCSSNDCEPLIIVIQVT